MVVYLPLATPCSQWYTNVLARPGWCRGYPRRRQSLLYYLFRSIVSHLSPPPFFVPLSGWHNRLSAASGGGSSFQPQSYIDLLVGVEGLIFHATRNALDPSAYVTIGTGTAPALPALRLVAAANAAAALEKMIKEDQRAESQLAAEKDPASRRKTIRDEMSLTTQLSKMVELAKSGSRPAGLTLIQGLLDQRVAFTQAVKDVDDLLTSRSHDVVLRGLAAAGVETAYLPPSVGAADARPEEVQIPKLPHAALVVLRCTSVAERLSAVLPPLVSEGQRVLRDVISEELSYLSGNAMSVLDDRVKSLAGSLTGRVMEPGALTLFLSQARESQLPFNIKAVEHNNYLHVTDGQSAPATSILGSSIHSNRAIMEACATEETSEYATRISLFRLAFGAELGYLREWSKLLEFAQQVDLRSTYVEGLISMVDMALTLLHDVWDAFQTALTLEAAEFSGVGVGDLNFNAHSLYGQGFMSLGSATGSIWSKSDYAQRYEMMGSSSTMRVVQAGGGVLRSGSVAAFRSRTYQGQPVQAPRPRAAPSGSGEAADRQHEAIREPHPKKLKTQPPAASVTTIPRKPRAPGLVGVGPSEPLAQTLSPANRDGLKQQCRSVGAASARSIEGRREAIETAGNDPAKYSMKAFMGCSPVLYTAWATHGNSSFYRGNFGAYSIKSLGLAGLSSADINARVSVDSSLVNSRNCAYGRLFDTQCPHKQCRFAGTHASATLAPLADRLAILRKAEALVSDLGLNDVK